MKTIENGNGSMGTRYKRESAAWYIERKDCINRPKPLVTN